MRIQSADEKCRQRTQMVNKTAKTRQIAAHTQPAMAYVKLPCNKAMLAQLRPAMSRCVASTRNQTAAACMPW